MFINAIAFGNLGPKRVACILKKKKIYKNLTLSHCFFKEEKMFLFKKILVVISKNVIESPLSLKYFPVRSM